MTTNTMWNLFRFAKKDSPVTNDAKDGFDYIKDGTVVLDRIQVQEWEHMRRHSKLRRGWCAWFSWKNLAKKDSPVTNDAKDGFDYIKDL